MSELGHDDVLAAARILSGVAHRTPSFTSRTLDERLGGSLVFKGEHLQRGGAFKFRGAFHALSRLDEAARRRGVLSWSSGNHAQGLALAGRLLEIDVTVVMPEDAIPMKRRATQGYGARVVSCEAGERERVGMELAEKEGRIIVPPYDHPHIIAGQGTAALELLADEGPFDLLLTPLGGGGLLAGTALAGLGEVDFATRPVVIGVEPEQADDGARSMAAGRIVTIDPPETIADGLRTRFVGEHNFAVIQRHVESILTVSEASIIEALRWLWLRMKLLVEPSSAVPLAALLGGQLDVSGKRVGVILSGGNVDPDSIGALIGD